MSKVVIFHYKKTERTFLFKEEEKVKELVQRFKKELSIDNNIYLLYEDKKIDEELTFQELVKDNNNIKIFVFDLFNIITGVIDVFEENKVIQIINSFEKWKLENNNINKEDIGEKNEKEIKDNVKIYLNDILIPFSYSYKFKEKGRCSIKYVFNNNITKLNYIFAECSNLTKIDLSKFKLENIKNMSHMFYNCKYLENIILSEIDTKNVVDISYMFYGCESLINLNLDSFDTNNINNMSYLFGNCFSIEYLDLSLFKTKNVIDMSGIFSNCESLQAINLSAFNTNNVINMDRMFFGCSSLSDIDISNFNIGNTNTIKEMFSGCKCIQKLILSNFNTRNVINMHGLFSECISLIYIDLSNFVTENCIDMGSLFSNCCSLIKLTGIEKWDTKKVRDMSNLFFNCSSLVSLPNISNWKTDEVIDMKKLFSKCSSLKSLPDISNWNTSKVTNMREMFSECTLLESIPNILKWNISKVNDISFMFSECSSLLCFPNISYWKYWKINSNLKIKGIFEGCSSAFSFPDLSKWKLKDKENISNIKIKNNNFINNKRKSKLVDKLNKENIIRNDNLKFLPQIEICFDKINALDLKEYLAFRKEIKQTFQEEDFSIIEIKKGSISMIITLQFLIFSELKNINYFWLWEQKAKNEIDILNDNFNKNIKTKILELISKCKQKTFISLGSVKPKYVDDLVLNLSDINIKEAVIKNMQDMATDDFFKDLNIIEFCKYIEKEDLEEYFSILTNQSYEQEMNQLKIIKDLEQFNKVFDREIERSLLKSIFEYKIIYIFLSNNDNIDYYKKGKKRCPNKKINILLHGTSPKNVTSIISSQFRQSFDQECCTFGRGVYFSNIIDYIWFYYSDEERGIFNCINTIPKINESFSFVASEIYYDSNKLEKVFDETKKLLSVQKNGMRIAYANYNTNILTKEEIMDNDKFISKEFLVSDRSQYLPLYGIVAKRVEYLVIWRDYNLDLNNPNDYSNESFQEIKEFHRKIKKLLSKMLNTKIYYVKSTEIAIQLLKRKKYNKIIIITNGGNNGKEFIIESRKIIGSNAIAAISAYDVFKHIKNNQDIQNVLVLNGFDSHLKFFNAVLRNDLNLLNELKNEIIKKYLEGTNLGFKEFNDEVFLYPNFKQQGKFHELIFNKDDNLFDIDLNENENTNYYINDDEKDCFCGII